MISPFLCVGLNIQRVVENATNMQRGSNTAAPNINSKNSSLPFCTPFFFSFAFAQLLTQGTTTASIQFLRQAPNTKTLTPQLHSMGDSLERLGSDGMGLDSTMKEDLGMEIDPPPFRENIATAEDWRRALNKVVPAVVVLRTTACRSFDTESAAASYATGFVVDKKRGIILTNRHVVKPGMLIPSF